MGLATEMKCAPFFGEESCCLAQWPVTDSREDCLEEIHKELAGDERVCWEMDINF